MKNAVLSTIIVLSVFAAGCKALYPDPPYLDPALRARMAPPFSPVAAGESGKSPFTAQREAANQAVAEILKIRPTYQISKEKAIKLAIVEVGAAGVETIRKEEKDEWRKALEETGLVKVVFITSNITTADPNFYDLRTAAARLDADAMLVYAAVDSRERGSNLSAFLYIAIVPIFFAPGSQAACLTFAKGACYDVKNEYLEFTVEGEAEKSCIRPYYFLDVKSLELKTRKAAIDILRDETVGALKAREAHYAEQAAKARKAD